jgi:hypothetical protein
VIIRSIFVDSDYLPNFDSLWVVDVENYKRTRKSKQKTKNSHRTTERTEENGFKRPVFFSSAPDFDCNLQTRVCPCLQ